MLAFSFGVFDRLVEEVAFSIVKTVTRPVVRALVFFTVFLVSVALLAEIAFKSKDAIARFLTVGPETQNLLPVFLVTTTILVVLGQVMLRYLRTDSVRVPDARITGMMARRIERLEAAALGPSPNDKERQELAEEIRIAALEGIIPKFEEQLSSKYAAAAKATARAQQVRARSDRILERLQDEVRALVKRGNLNLVLGTLTTVVALVALAWVAATVKLGENLSAFLSIYLVRLSLVVFIEIFAFFFLRLYRDGLADIKYFQNEITNVEAKVLALEFATLAGDEKAAEKVVEDLAATERNFVLRKGETTVELEKARIDSKGMRDLAALIREAMPRLRDKGGK